MDIILVSNTQDVVLVPYFIERYHQCYGLVLENNSGSATETGQTSPLTLVLCSRDKAVNWDHCAQCTHLMIFPLSPVPKPPLYRNRISTCWGRPTRSYKKKWKKKRSHYTNSQSLTHSKGRWDKQLNWNFTFSLLINHKSVTALS